MGSNAAWLVAARLGAQALNVLFSAFVARALGQEGFGQYSFIAATVFLANVLTTFGTDTLLIRSVARQGRLDGEQAWAVLLLQTVLSTLAAAAIFAGEWLFPPRSAPAALGLRLYTLALFPLALYSVLAAVLRGLERMDLYLAANLFTSAAQAAGALLVLKLGGGLVELATALLGVQVLSAAFTLWLARRQAARFRLLPQGSGMRKEAWLRLAAMLRAVWPLAAISILGVASQRMGVLAMSAFTNDAQTGLYAAAARVLEALKIGPIAVLGALLPALSRFQKRESRLSTLKWAAWMLLGWGLAGAAASSLLAGPLVGLLYGERFGPSAAALKSLVWALLPYCLSALLSTWMVARGEERKVLVAQSLGFVAALGLYLWLIPRRGLEGACLATLAVESIQAAVLGFMGSFPWIRAGR